MSRGCLLASAESQTLYDDTEARGPALRQDEFLLVEVEVPPTVARETQGLPTTDELECRSAFPEPLLLSFFLSWAPALAQHLVPISNDRNLICARGGSRSIHPSPRIPLRGCGE